MVDDCIAGYISKKSESNDTKNRTLSDYDAIGNTNEFLKKKAATRIIAIPIKMGVSKAKNQNVHQPCHTKITYNFQCYNHYSFIKAIWGS